MGTVSDLGSRHPPTCSSTEKKSVRDLMISHPSPRARQLPSHPASRHAQGPCPTPVNSLSPSFFSHGAAFAAHSQASGHGRAAALVDFCHALMNSAESSTLT